MPDVFIRRVVNLRSKLGAWSESLYQSPLFWPNAYYSKSWHYVHCPCVCSPRHPKPHNGFLLVSGWKRNVCSDILFGETLHVNTAAVHNGWSNWAFVIPNGWYQVRLLGILSPLGINLSLKEGSHGTGSKISHPLNTLPCKSATLN